jgi:hypothetical protein
VVVLLHRVQLLQLPAVQLPLPDQQLLVERVALAVRAEAERVALAALVAVVAVDSAEVT